MSNSNNWADPEVRKIYREQNLLDEIARFFPPMDHGKHYESRVEVTVPGPPDTNISKRYSTGDHIHHIGSGQLGTPRWDIVTNLIACCLHTHHFCETYSRDGLILCAAAKIDKGEWDSRKMAEIMRVDSVRGWVEAGVIEFPWVEPIYQKYKERI